MNSEENKIGFDLSELSLQELIKVYTDIDDFIKYLGENKIVMEEEKKEDDE